MPTSIPDLPLELLYLIAKHLGIQALLAFSRTCHILHHLLTPQLNIHLATRAPSIVCLYLRRRPHPSLLQRALSFCPPGFFIHDLGLLTDLITWGFTDTVRLLLQHRVVDPNSYRKGEWEKQSEPTPLLAAVYSENMEVIGLLLDAGASVALGCPQPVEVARRLQRGTGKGEMVRLLERFGRQKSSKAEGNLK